APARVASSRSSAWARSRNSSSPRHTPTRAAAAATPGQPSYSPGKPGPERGVELGQVHGHTTRARVHAGVQRTVAEPPVSRLTWADPCAARSVPDCLADDA